MQSAKGERFCWEILLVRSIIMATNGKQEAGNCSRNGGNVVNELMILFLENDWLMYGVCGVTVLGSLIPIVLSVIYNRSLNASDRMRSTRMAWLKQMKTRFESGYEWDNRIRNVELFVDKVSVHLPLPSHLSVHSDGC